MSRLNKALDRIKTKGVVEHQRVQPVRSHRRDRALNGIKVEDPLAKSIRTIDIPAETLNNSHLISELIDPTVRTSYKMLRTRILQIMQTNNWQSIAVTSASQGDGKTVTAINLAISLAGDVNHNVCLVDLDLRHSSIARYLDIDTDVGISDCLKNNVPVEQVLVRPDIDRLVFLPNAHWETHSSELLSSPKMHLMSERLSAAPSRIIIYDKPPILAADDLLAFKDNTDAILFVVSEGVTSRMDALRARELMEDLNVVGTVLNRSDEKTASYY